MSTTKCPPDIDAGDFLLTALKSHHAPALFELRTNSAAMQYINRVKPHSIDEVLSMIDCMQDEFQLHRTSVWAIVQKEDGRLAGTIGYYRMLPEHFRGEIGYMLHPDFWGKGIMQKLIDIVIKHGFEKMELHSIEARINPENLNSRKILERSGFVSEGYLRESFYFDGQFLDSEVFGLIKK